MNWEDWKSRFDGRLIFVEDDREYFLAILHFSRLMERLLNIDDGWDGN
jgi:hypothetical protein